MFRLLGLAALIGAAWALFRRKPRGVAPPHGRKTDTTIVIGGTPTAPIVTQHPEPLDANTGDKLEWEVINRSGGTQEISLEKFNRKGSPAGRPPLERTDADRRVRTGGTAVIKDRVRANAQGGSYKYSIFLNGAEAVDPDIEIHEFA